MSNDIERSKRSALQGFHPRALQLAKVLATSIQAQNRPWPTDPLALQREVQERGVENI